jgi:hypothetical protein
MKFLRLARKRRLARCDAKARNRVRATLDVHGVVEEVLDDYHWRPIPLAREAGEHL